MREKYLASKIPLAYALLFALNVVLFVVFEALVLYTLPKQPTPELLSKKDPAYTECQILHSESNGDLRCHLIQLSDGSLELVATRRQDFLLNRFRIVDRQTVIVPEQEKATVNIRFGIHNVPVTVGNIHYGVQNDPEKTYDGYFIEPFFVSYPGGRGLPVKYLLVGALLELLELAAYSFVKRNL